MSTSFLPRQLCDYQVLVTATFFGKLDPILKEALQGAAIGAHTNAAVSQMGWMALNDCLAVLRGAIPALRVTI